MAKLYSDWTNDSFGNRILVVKKKRGGISQAELADHIRYDLQQYGIYIAILNATEATCGVGWLEETEPGDKVVLYPYDGSERCPVCSQLAVPTYCVMCGHPIDPLQDYDEPITVFRNSDQGRPHLYQAACRIKTRSGSTLQPCGVADSLTGALDLVCKYVRTQIYFEGPDPLLDLPVPEAGALPARIARAWPELQLELEYTIEEAPILLQRAGAT